MNRILNWTGMVVLCLGAWSTLIGASQTEQTAQTGPDGQVTVSLIEYQRLLQQATTLPLSAPSDYAIGQSVLDVVFHQREGHVTATVQARIDVETFDDKWTLVPLLSPGAALESATVNHAPVQLVQRAEGLFWLAETRRKTSIELVYHVDSRFADRAYITGLPIPRAAATRFTVRIPKVHLDLVVTPATNLMIQENNAQTIATGTMPGSTAMMVSWRVAVPHEFVLTRAEYSGVIQNPGQTPGKDTAIAWRARISAELLTDGEVSVPLFSESTTLVAAEIDGEPAMVFSEDGHFAMRLAGAGKHRIDLRFLSPVTYPDGVPSTDFDIPDVPVSKFTLSLAGDKQVRAIPQIGPAASIDASHENGSTVATFHIPMSTHLALNWMDALPADIDVERRANAVVYHALNAAEGVLYGLASIRYEISRGDTNVLEFSIPASAQVNQITSPANAIADWVVLEEGAEMPAGTGDQRHIRVFLNRAVSGEFILDIAFEQLLEERENGGGTASAPIQAPVLRALGVTRQKGMVALLSGTDLALEPLQHENMAEVGENQLPAFFRNQLEQAVSHTFKFHSPEARLMVHTVMPEHRQGKFNAQIDTLISIGEVTLKGQVSIENDVKSGVLRELHLLLPGDVNILGVSGPSIRNHTVSLDNGKQKVDIEFTREMDGQFRIELNYERIMLDGTDETGVPRVEVSGADVAHGRIAIEALSALEVQAVRTEQMSSLEINELPRHLVLKTTNPILLAYRYVETEKPISLQLSITRHEEIEVQVAAIDTANYQTLFTSDGLAVTRVQFDVRNSRRQFLRMSLPAPSEIWSVFVNGNAQKPAYATDSRAGAVDILIKMVNSDTAFPVELVYATRGNPMSNFGSIQGSLPRPDMIVTRTNWDVFVPAQPRYGAPKSNMEILAQQVMTSVKGASIELLRGAVANVISGEPLHIDLPAQGLLFRFAKLYANQSPEDAHFSMRYVNRSAGLAGMWLSLLATMAVWAGIAWLGRAADTRPVSRSLIPGLSLVLGGAIVLTVSISVLGASVIPPSVLSLAVAISLAGRFAWQWWNRNKKEMHARS